MTGLGTLYMYHLEQQRLCNSADASSNNEHKYKNMAWVHKCETRIAYETRKCSEEQSIRNSYTHKPNAYSRQPPFVIIKPPRADPKREHAWWSETDE